MTTSPLNSPAYPDTRLLIDNQWVDAADGRTLDVLNPATGQVIGRVAHAGIPDLDRALAAAQRGFETWRDTPAHERAGHWPRARLHTPRVPRVAFGPRAGTHECPCIGSTS